MNTVMISLLSSVDSEKNQWFRSECSSYLIGQTMSELELTPSLKRPLEVNVIAQLTIHMSHIYEFLLLKNVTRNARMISSFLSIFLLDNCFV